MDPLARRVLARFLGSGGPTGTVLAPPWGMRASCAGWEVVCPDGRVRHPPYHNHGDAEADAAIYTRVGCIGRSKRPSRLAARQPPCPEGAHTVEAAAFTHLSGAYEA